MKFIIDAHLPKSIAAFFSEHDVIHTSEFEEGNRTKDKCINSLSVWKTAFLSPKTMTSITLMWQHINQ